MKHLDSILVAGVALVACVGSSVLTAQAVPSTINFTGQILAEPLFGTPTGTATVTGSYTFETTTPDSSADPATGIDLGAITALSFTVDGKNGAHPLPTMLPAGGLEDDSLNITFLNSAFPGEVFMTQGVVFFPTVPEPGGVVLLGSGVVGLAWFKRKAAARNLVWGH